MASLLKKSSSGGSRGLIGIIIIILIVLGCFFLPELLRFGMERQAKVAVEGAVSELAEAVPDDIDLLLRPISISQERVSSHDENGESRKQSIQKTSANVAECPVPAASAENREELLIPVEGKLTWKDLESDRVQELLKGVHEKSRKLYAIIPEEYFRSRFELLAFISALSRVREADESLSPEQALLLLDYADSEVSYAFADERVDRTLRLEWNAISIAPVLRQPLSVRLKNELPGPYSPSLTLVEVEAVYDKVKEEKLLPYAQASVSLRGFVKGADTAEAEWFIGNRDWEARRIKLEKPDEYGRRFFYVKKIREARGKTITIRAKSTDGVFFEKYYQVFPKVREFHLTKKQGRYQYQVATSPFDPRLDKTFLLRQARFNPKQGDSALSSRGPLTRF